MRAGPSAFSIFPLEVRAGRREGLVGGAKGGGGRRYMILFPCNVFKIVSHTSPKGEGGKEKGGK